MERGKSVFIPANRKVDTSSLVNVKTVETICVDKNQFETRIQITSIKGSIALRRRGIRQGYFVSLPNSDWDENDDGIGVVPVKHVKPAE